MSAEHRAEIQAVVQSVAASAKAYDEGGRSSMPIELDHVTSLMVVPTRITATSTTPDDAIHASPPCQLYSKTHRINLSDFPDLIGPTRDLLEQTGLPYIIENVEDARPELREPVMLCGAMFGIETYRHRLFETNWGFRQPGHPPHVAKTTKMGRAVKPGEFMHVVGNFSGVDHGRKVMGMPWANRDGLREAIPPVYSEWVGSALLEHLAGELVGVSHSFHEQESK